MSNQIASNSKRTPGGTWRPKAEAGVEEMPMAIGSMNLLADGAGFGGNGTDLSGEQIGKRGPTTTLGHVN
jgi:hypothetical protein